MTEESPEIEHLRKKNLQQGLRLAELDVALQIATATMRDHCDLLEAAFGVIANSYGGNWGQADTAWQDAAARWRDDWHRLIKEHCTRGPEGDPR